MENQTTASYKETPYEDAQYEIVGEPPPPEEFVPMSIEFIQSDRQVSDPMFHDYGGGNNEPNQVRWHLPEGLGHVAPERQEQIENLALQQEEQHMQMLEMARNDGYEEGRAVALEESKAQYEVHNQQVNARMTELLRDLTRQLQERIQIIEKKAVEMTIAVTERLVPQAVEINPEYIIGILREALGLSGGAVIKKIRVSPDDKEFIDIVGLQQSIKEFDGSWEFISDETIRAGCIMETSAGEVEYDLMKGWERIKDNVMKVLK